MNITVILCTYNRCQRLAQTLDSVAGSKLPDSIKWEVLVVDNNSDDQTQQVVADFCRRHPRHFRYLFEPQQGKSWALNSGVKEAVGNVLAFMDDDVTVEPTWLWNLTSALDSHEWAGAGGKILPEREIATPRWLSVREQVHARGPLGIFDQGTEPGSLSSPPYGANMAFRKAMFEKYGGFRTDLGHRSGQMIFNEDVEFGRRLLAAGERLRYEPSAVVYHSVTESRLDKKFLRRWHFNKARSDIRLFGLPSDTKWRIFGIPLYMFRRLARWALQGFFTFDQRGRFDCTLSASRVAGQIVECMSLSREEKH